MTGSNCVHSVKRRYDEPNSCFVFSDTREGFVPRSRGAQKNNRYANPEDLQGSDSTKQNRGSSGPTREVFLPRSTLSKVVPRGVVLSGFRTAKGTSSSGGLPTVNFGWAYAILYKIGPKSSSARLYVLVSGASMGKTVIVSLHRVTAETAESSKDVLQTICLLIGTLVSGTTPIVWKTPKGPRAPGTKHQSTRSAWLTTSPS